MQMPGHPKHSSLNYFKKPLFIVDDGKENKAWKYTLVLICFVCFYTIFVLPKVRSNCLRTIAKLMERLLSVLHVLMNSPKSRNTSQMNFWNRFWRLHGVRNYLQSQGPVSKGLPFPLQTNRERLLSQETATG